MAESGYWNLRAERQWNGEGNVVDDLTVMWQSAPRRRGGDGIGTEDWFGHAPADPLGPPPDEVPAHVPDPVDEGQPLERLEAQICSLAGHLAASTHDWLVLIAEF